MLTSHAFFARSQRTAALCRHGPWRASARLPRCQVPFGQRSAGSSTLTSRSVLYHLSKLPNSNRREALVTALPLVQNTGQRSQRQQREVFPALVSNKKSVYTCTIKRLRIGGVVRDKMNTVQLSIPATGFSHVIVFDADIVRAPTILARRSIAGWVGRSTINNRIVMQVEWFTQCRSCCYI